MRARPLIYIQVPCSSKQVLSRVQEQLQRTSSTCEATLGRASFTLSLSANERHLWSPCVTISVRAHERGSSLRGYLGPHPTLWAAFVGVYALGVFGFIAGVTYGGVELSLGWEPTGLYAALISGIFLALACALDLWGRRIGQAQMVQIRQFISDAMEGEYTELSDQSASPKRRSL